MGTITREETIAWGLIGPVARARGVDIDARRDHPYAAYNDMKFDVPVLTDGDVWSTLVVRVLETYEAIRIIRQVLDKMPAGPIFVELKDKIPALRHAITTVEAPRGEVDSLCHHRRGQPAGPLAGAGADLYQPAGRAADAAQ